MSFSDYQGRELKRSACNRKARVLQPDRVIHSDSDLLFRPEIPLGGLDGRVPEQELDLLEIAARLAAELGAGAPEVMGAEVLDADLARGLLDDVQDGPVA